MLPLLNGKDLLSCDEDDLSILIDNSDYRENEYIDYKKNFAFLEMNKGKERDTKRTEFKCDVCSFANADGGYLIFGVSDKNGCVSSIHGICIENNDTDRFELDRRNDLNGIQPKIPQIHFGFIKLKSERFIVIMYIKHDSFAPYVYLEDEKNYKVYKRYGNGKRAVAYNEMRQMFNQSTVLEESISTYIRKRIDYYKNMKGSFGSSFVHFCILPDTFMNTFDKKNMYMLEKRERINFSSMFSAMNCNSHSIPCVDGLRFIPYSDCLSRAEGYVKNNGVIEACQSLDEHLYRNKEKYPNGYLPWGWLWHNVYETCCSFASIFGDLDIGDRYYIYLSIIGCRNVKTEDKEFAYDYIGVIDRDEIICDPIEITRVDLLDKDNYEKALRKLHLSFLLSIGIKYDDTLKQLINEIYA